MLYTRTSLALFFLLIAFSLFKSSVYADSNPAASLSLSSNTGHQGEEITATVTIPDLLSNPDFIYTYRLEIGDDRFCTHTANCDDDDEHGKLSVQIRNGYVIEHNFENGTAWNVSTFDFFPKTTSPATGTVTFSINIIVDNLSGESNNEYLVRTKSSPNGVQTIWDTALITKVDSPPSEPTPPPIATPPPACTSTCESGIPTIATLNKDSPPDATSYPANTRFSFSGNTNCANYPSAGDAPLRHALTVRNTSNQLTGRSAEIITDSCGKYTVPSFTIQSSDPSGNTAGTWIVQITDLATSTVISDGTLEILVDPSTSPEDIQFSCGDKVPLGTATCGEGGTPCCPAECVPWYDHDGNHGEEGQGYCGDQSTPLSLCPICTDDFPYFSSIFNVCCKKRSCEVLPADDDQIKTALDSVIGDAAKKQKYLELLGTLGYSATADNTTCSSEEVCLQNGRGCIDPNLDPTKPPCVAGTDNEGNEIDLQKEDSDGNPPLIDAQGNIVGDASDVEAAVDKITHCTKVNTAVGILDTSADSITRSIFGILLSISGMVALFIILKSGYQMMTSQGNPEVIQAAKDSLTSAIVGLLFLIFSMVILQVIGVDILQLPGFGG